MYRFNSDYLEGAHPNIIDRLVRTNSMQTPGYGLDPISDSAKDKIRAACKAPDAKVYFMVGGTQTNYTVLDSILKRYEGVLAADTGHVAVHEAGAIEYSGHKVITIPEKDGKVSYDRAKALLESFYADGSWQHMVRPGAIYISHPSEYGTLYSKAELALLRSLCDEYGMRLFLDGARLGYALASQGTDLTLGDIAELCDVFYIGGTKVGALFGEAVVFTNPDLGEAFFTEIKQHGALLAKGRMLGIQFDELFTDDLYISIADHAVKLAMRIKNELKAKGYRFYNDSYTNQQFPIISKEKLDSLEGLVALDDWGPFGDIEDKMRLVRITTSWATSEEAVDALLSLL
ncbi:MAG: aminotransferase class I/II-fold pyridoxal phosphate-dependent enzyme [Clostridia bacterium]|nr:aminotransferase class I/II-fold pyridoxal phosphate-dependent enzyme [Clostridia bacterium]